ncbi:MAG: ATP-binding protein [Candidatus Sericytochromatia bacterium]|nr:ATP-binding protein [Candidatus Sericytochromatia bacterium]
MSLLRPIRGRPLRLWLFLLLLGAMLVPLGLSSYATIQQHRRELSRIEGASLAQASGTARLAERYLVFALAQARHAIEGMSPRERRTPGVLRHLVDELPVLAAIDVLDMKGRLIASSLAGQDVDEESDRGLAQTAIRMKRAQASGYIASKRLKRPIVSLCVPLMNIDGQVTGAYRLVLRLEFLLQEFISETRSKDPFYTFFVDQRGTLIAAQNFRPGRNLQNLEPVSLLLSGRDGTVKYVSTFFGDLVDGEERLGAYRHIGDTGWGLVVTHPATSIGSPVLRDLRATLLTIVLSGILSLLLALWTGRWLLEPLEDLARRMDLAAASPPAPPDTMPSAPVGVVEYRQLETAYASLTARIHAQFQQLAQANERLESLVHERTSALEDANASLQERGLALEEANERLTSLVNELRRLDALQSDFLANVSHELRTPITFITAYGSSLEDGLLGHLTPAQLEAVGFMLEGADRLTRLVDDLLDLNRLESGVLALHTEALDPRDLIEGVVAAMRPLAAQRAQRLTSAIEPELPEILADGDRLAQILRNLLSNALKFTPDGRSIVVRARRDSDYAVLSVCDEGIGIPAQALPHLFERFYQVDGSSTKAFAGAGIGLNIVRHLTELMNGKVSIKSIEGTGTTVDLMLPLAGPTSERTPTDRISGAYVPFRSESA